MSCKHLHPAGLMCAVVFALCACSRQPADRAPAVPASTPGYVAIARGQVDVEGGLIRINAPRDGVLSQVHGEPGSTVKAGDVLAVLDLHQSELAAGIAQAELDQADAHTAALRARVAGLKQRADRAHEAAQAGAAAAQSADDASQALAELNAEIGEAAATVAAAQQRLKQARHEIEIRTLRAPVSGRVVARNAHAGDVVSAQSATALLTLLPDAPRIVRAELNEAFVAKVAPGMGADIVAEAGSDKVYKATVTRIGDVFGPSKLVEDAQEASDTRDVECILQLQSDELRVGQRVQVRFRPR
jgi:macrolide-specific efflux system membrane fusion protein